MKTFTTTIRILGNKILILLTITDEIKPIRLKAVDIANDKVIYLEDVEVEHLEQQHRYMLNICKDYYNKDNVHHQITSFLSAKGFKEEISKELVFKSYKEEDIF